MPVSQGLNEIGGSGVVGSGGGHHLKHRNLRVLVGGGQRHRGDTVDRLHLLLEVGHQFQRIPAGDDVGGQHQRAVAPHSEMLRDQIVGDAVWGPRGVLPGVRQGGTQSQTRDRQRPEANHHDQQHHDGMPGGDATPPGKRTTSAGPATPPGPSRSGSQSLPQQPHQRGQHRQRDEHRQHDGQGRERAHHSEERNPRHPETEQGDEYRQSGEHHRRTGGPDGAGRRLLRRHTLAQLVAMAGEDEQGVVDADRESQHHGQHRGGRVDAGQAGEKQHDGHGHPHPRDRGQQRQPGGHQGTEHQRQHHQRYPQPGSLRDAQTRQFDVEGLTPHVEGGALRQPLGHAFGDGTECGKLLSGRGALGVDQDRDDGGPAIVGNHAGDPFVPRGCSRVDEVDRFQLGDSVLDDVAEIVDPTAFGGHEDRSGLGHGALREGHP